MPRFLKTLAGLALAFAIPAVAEEKLETAKDRVPNTTADIELVKIPAGKVTIKDKDGKDKEYDIKSIWIGKYEIDWDQYQTWALALDIPEKERPAVQSDKKVIRSRPSVPYESPERNWGHDGFPAGSMFCREAKNYCKYLSDKTGKKYRLATEAEWEYACRAGGPPLKPEKSQLKEMAWYEGNSDDQAHHIGEKKPNAWGLYDMLGNLAEWVTMMDGSEAVAGGSWNDPAEEVHSGARQPFNSVWQKTDPQDPKGRSWLSNGGHVGFRIVRED